MNTFAVSNGLKRLFGFSAMIVVALSMLVLSGCGHRCKCNNCQKNTSCSSCSTCGVSDNAPPPTCSTCSTCNTCPTTSSYDRVGAAPASLSEPVVIQAQPSYATQPSYSTGSSYPSTNTSLIRAGESRDLPTFSAAPVTPLVATSEPVYSRPAPQQQAAVILPTANCACQYHTLAQGETIYGLSRRYNVNAKAILEANHFNDPNHLSVGTKVTIPAH